MNVLSNVKLVLQLLPLIIDTVKAIEAAFPEGGQGKAKLELVRTVIESAYNTTSGIIDKFDVIWPMIQNTVAAVVATFNATGAFKR